MKSTSIMGLCQLLFIIAKLAGYIDWSWWVVLIPLWIHLGIIAAVVAFVGLMLLLVGIGVIVDTP